MNEDLEGNKLSFLLFGSCNYLPESYTVLRSYLRVHSSNLASEYNLKLPKCFTNKNFFCPFCFTSWKSNAYSFKLVPSTGKNFKTSHLSKKVSKNKLAIKCELCKRNSLFSLIKPQCNTKNDLAAICETAKKKKKKKKKNCFANLNPSACKSAALQLKSEKKSSCNSKNTMSNYKLKTLNKKKSNSKNNNSKKTKNKESLDSSNNSFHNNSKKNLVNNKRKMSILQNAIKKKTKIGEKSSVSDFLNLISK